MQESKVCTKCGADKALDEYYAHSKGGLRPSCKECIKSQNRLNDNKGARKKYVQNNRDKIRERHRKWRIKNPDKIRKYRELSKIFPEDLFVRLWDVQEGLCAVCLSSLSDIPAHLIHRDHCHTTNTARGVLCHKCNVGLGMFNDNVDLLTRAIGYLKRPSIEAEIHK